MPRVRYAEPAYVVDQTADPGTQVNQALQGILAHRPDAAAALGTFAMALAASSTLGPRLNGAGPAAHRLPQPVPQLHGRPLPGRRRRRAHRGPGVLAGATRRGARPRRRRARSPSASPTCSPPTTSPSTTTSTPTCASTSRSRRSSSSACNVRPVRGRRPALGHVGT